MVPAPAATQVDRADGLAGDLDETEATDEAVAPPATSTADSPCPEDMVLVQGEHCFLYEQVCLRWDDPIGQPRKRVCAKFQEPSTCTTRKRHMRFCIDRDEYRAKGEQLPMSGVSWEQASKICQAQGKRLCRNVEWEFACEGEQGLPYPYGYERSPSLCNTDRLLRDGKTHAGDDLREPPHPSCVSPFGVRDMVGNVDEWVTRPFREAPNRSELRGGWWLTGRNRCRANTTSHDERYSDRQTGFRCCKGLGEEPPGVLVDAGRASQNP